MISAPACGCFLTTANSSSVNFSRFIQNLFGYGNLPDIVENSGNRQGAHFILIEMKLCPMAFPGHINLDTRSHCDRLSTRFGINGPIVKAIRMPKKNIFSFLGSNPESGKP
jgi:hypothetical protein